MKNITLNIIGQRVLADILYENKENIEMNILIFENFKEYSKNDETNNIIITNLSNFEIIEKLNPSISIPIFYLSNNKNNVSNKTKFQKYEIIYYPFNLKNFIEKINLLYIKSKFADNSNINFLNYNININSKEIFKDKKKLKLTEREKDFLLFLKNSSKPQKIKNILESVWGYSKGIETHTVETHVHRLRKKFLNTFGDNNLIKNNKKGYYI